MPPVRRVLSLRTPVVTHSVFSLSYHCRRRRCVVSPPPGRSVGPSRNRKHKQYANRYAIFFYRLPFRPRLIASYTRARTDATRVRHVFNHVVPAGRGKNCVSRVPAAGRGRRIVRVWERNKRQQPVIAPCGTDANRKSRACRRCIFNRTSASSRTTWAAHAAYV